MSDYIVLRDTSPVIVDVEGMGAPGPIGPPGDVAKSLTRAAMAGEATAANLSRYLVEEGREGLFVFSTANLSAQVTADPAQGVYVAPTSDITGASGAWVRRFEHNHHITWFGAVGDNVTDDGPAFLAAIAFLKAIRLTGFGYGAGSGDLIVPATSAAYYLGTSTLDLTHTVRLTGEGTGLTGGSASVLRWAAGATGVRVQAYNTSGASGTRTPDADNSTGSGSTIERLFLQGGYVAPTEGEFHGIHLRGMATVRDVYISGFPGDGIHAEAGIGGGAIEGNANLSRIENVTIERCRHGIYFDGADSNACNIVAANVSANRAWGVWDSSFLGNTYTACHAAANGWDGAIGSIPTGSTFGGNRYFVMPGQAAGASTNAPSGTTADNTWWGYIGAGGVYNGIVAWVSGTTFREGGAYKTDDGNAQNMFGGCYWETDQNPPQLIAPSIVVGGNLSASTRGTAIRFASDPSGALQVGHKAGSADFDLHLENSGATSKINFRNWAAGVGTVQASIFNVNTNIYTDAVAHRWRLSGADKILFYAPAFQPSVNNDLDLGSSTERWKAIYGIAGNFSGAVTGTGFNVGVNQVVGAQGAAVADATDAATVITQLNALLARCRAHGLIAT